MNVQTNFNLTWKDILKLYNESRILAKKYNNWFDWRILTHPTKNEKLILNKILKNKKFLNFVSSHLKPIDWTLIEFCKNKKPLTMKNLRNITSPQNLMILKKKELIKRISYYEYKLNENGYEIDRFRPDFLIENNTQDILIEVSKIGKKTMIGRLNELASRFEIYKRLLKYKTILVLFSEEKLLENEIDKLGKNCNYILINDVDKLVDILRSG